MRRFTLGLVLAAGGALGSSLVDGAPARATPAEEEAAPAAEPPAVDLDPDIALDDLGVPGNGDVDANRRDLAVVNEHGAAGDHLAVADLDLGPGDGHIFGLGERHRRDAREKEESRNSEHV